MQRLARAEELIPQVKEPPFDFKSFHRNLVIGAPNSGKSTLCEFVAELAKANGFQIIDLFDSGSGENLCWCLKGKDQYFKEDEFATPIPIKGRRYKVLIITPKYVELEGCGGSNGYVEYISDDVSVEEMIAKAYNEDRILILGHRLYKRSLGESLKVFAKIMQELPELNRDKFRYKIMYVIRETALAAFSQMRGIHENESLSRRALFAFSKISRHFKTSFVQDTQLMGDVHSSITSLQDRLLIKFSTERMLPEGYHWIWDKVEKMRLAILKRYNYSTYGKRLAGIFYPSINELEKWEFYAVYPDDTIKLFRNPMPTFHHKEPEDIWEDMAKIRIHYIQSKTPDEMAQHGNKLMAEKIRVERLHYLLPIVQDQLTNGAKNPSWLLTLQRFNAKVNAEGKPSLQFKTVNNTKSFYCRFKETPETTVN